MIRGRRGEHWARSFHAAPWVSYAEALCWIYYRDVDAIASLGILSSDRDYAEMGSGMVEALLSMEAGTEDWRAASPELTLLDALEAGKVRATAHPFILLQLTQASHYGRTDRREILPTEWLDVRLYDAPAPFDKATTAYPKALPHGARAAGGFTDIWFSRADLTQEFPGEGANQVVSLASIREQAAAPATGPGTATEFLRRPDNYAAARRTLREKGEEVTKGAMLRELAQLFHDAGGTYSANSVAALAKSFKARCGSNALDISLERMNAWADRAERSAAVR